MPSPDDYKIDYNTGVGGRCHCVVQTTTVKGKFNQLHLRFNCLSSDKASKKLRYRTHKNRSKRIKSLPFLDKGNLEAARAWVLEVSSGDGGGGAVHSLPLQVFAVPKRTENRLKKVAKVRRTKRRTAVAMGLIHIRKIFAETEGGRRSEQR